MKFNQAEAEADADAGAGAGAGEEVKILPISKQTKASTQA